MRKTDARKLRLAAVGVACLATLASAPMAVTALGEHGIELPGLASAHNLMAMLDARSPGERAKGALTQSKVRLSQADKPRARALGKVFPPKPSPMEQLAKVVVSQPPVPPVEIVSVVPVAPGAPAMPGLITPSSLIASVPLTSGSVIIGGSALPPPTNTPPQTNIPTPPGEVASPVPEPGTWLMMLLGFGMVGSAMSRCRVRTAPATA